MSRSPIAAGSLNSKDVEGYLGNWDALAQMIQRGASLSGRERHCCFLNTGTHPFADISAASGLDLMDDGRGIALVDWDGDGDLDMWISNRNGPRVRLMRNEIGTGNHFLALQLVGTSCNRDAIGARVAVVVEGRGSSVEGRGPGIVEGRGLSVEGREPDAAGTLRSGRSRLIKTLRAGEGFLSQSSKWIHFGLGEAAEVERVVVRWPGDAEGETFTGLKSNQCYRLVQGSGRAELVPVRSGHVRLTTSVAKSPPATERARTVLTERRQLPSLSYQDFEGRRHTLQQEATGACLINLWASWCQPCIEELSELARDETELRAKGLSIIACCVDQVGSQRTTDLSAARTVIRQIGWPFATAVATESLVRELSELHNHVFYRHRPLPLPCSFLLDRSGRLAAIYKGPVSVPQLLHDLSLLNERPERIAQQAFPFPGSQVTRMYDPHPLSFAEAYLEGGYLDDARIEVMRYLKNVGSAKDLASLAELLSQKFGPAVMHDRTAPSTGDAHTESIAAHNQSDPKGQHDRTPDSASSIDIQRILEAHQRRGMIRAFRLLATIDRTRGSSEGELAALGQLLKLQPTNPTVHLDLAVALARNNKPDEAAGHITEARRLAGEDTRGLAAVAQAQMILGQVSAGLESFRQAMRQTPEDVGIRLNYAMALHLAGATDKAVDEYARILEKDPQSREAANNLAWIRATHPDAGLRDAKQAIELATPLCEATGYSLPSYLDTLAAALAEAGRFAEAARIAQSAQQLARARGEYSLAEKLAQRWAQYRDGKPMREVVRTRAKGSGPESGER